MPSNGTAGERGPLLDCNVHLWDQSENPVFWLTDRTVLRDLIGNYDALPDRYTLADYERDTAGRGVGGVIWSDAGAADPLAAAAWAAGQQGEHGLVRGIVTLGDPASPDFPAFVRRCRDVPLITSVRVRLAASLRDTSTPATPRSAPDDETTHANLELLAESGLVATVEATGDQLDAVATLVERHPELLFVVDHFGWPTDHSDAGRREHLDRLKHIAGRPNTATRIDALSTVFGNWTLEQARSWLLPVTETFGPDRCMLGSDLPIDRFDAVYEAYDAAFAGYTDAELRMLFHDTAERWYTPG
ncbi:amidohydrolase family protein [Streptomyces sp. NPDC051907]|uniref:amidohydrolase family protein n=1 Tax=Streptomyces sp. NPDC051907 TaxID=3155284 RepID=UPI0034394768